MDYSNQDFIAKMTELLTMLKTMSSGYDPTISSESDPIVVLLKEMGMADDQIAYLIDKAVGELMPSRVQQRQNAIELFSSLGYTAKKYRSAIGEVTLRLKNTTGLIGTGNVGIIEVDRFTRIGDSSGQHEYVTLEKVQWLYDTATEPRLVPVMEGKLKELQIGGSTEIRLIHLDEQYRLYFPEKNVAENGIFIRLGSGEEFRREDNVFSLTSHDIYYVGEDENGEVYIQFPSTIVQTLGTGGVLNVKYLVTDGVKGNCKQGTLTTVLDEIVDQTLNVNITEKIEVRQIAPINSGRDPESIDDMYKNFKRTQNKLNTLVTTKDYEGAAYIAEDKRKPLWSNVVVGSRTDDLNQTIQIKRLDNFVVKDYYRLLNSTSIENKVEPQSMFVYGLYNSNDYNTQFAIDTSSGALTKFQSLVQEIRAINQDIRNPVKPVGETACRYGFLNTFFLAGMIVLKNPVTKKESQEIKDRVMQGLERVYSARQRQWGQEPSYQEMVDTIVNSDSRIQSVAISIPRYQIKKIVEGEVGGKQLTLDDKIDLVSKMILRGDIQLYKHDEGFNFSFGEVAQGGTIDNIVEIETVAGNKSGGSDKLIDGYTIQRNEAVQVKGAKYRTIVEYGALVNYRFEGNGDRTLAEDLTLTQDAVLGEGSSVKVDSTVIVNIQQGTLTEPLINDMKLKIGSTLKKDSIIANDSTGIAAGTLTQDQTLTGEATLKAGSKIASKSTLILAEDYTFNFASGVKAESVLKAGSVIVSGSSLEGDIVSRVLERNKDNILAVGDNLAVKYNNGGVIETKKYETGAIVRPSFDLKQTFVAGDYPKTLAVGESIGIRAKATSVIPRGTKVYYVSDNQKLTIDTEYDLTDKEYLVYTSSDMDELVVINPHTKLTSSEKIEITFGTRDSSLTDITTQELDKIDWGVLPSDLIVEDQEIYSFGEGITATTNTPLSKEWAEIESLEVIDSKGNKEEFKHQISSDRYKARIILNLVATDNQKLYEDQSIKVKKDGGEWETISYQAGENLRVAFDKPTVAIGGEINKVTSRRAIAYSEKSVEEGEGESVKKLANGVLGFTKDMLEQSNGRRVIPYNFYKPCIVSIYANTNNGGRIGIKTKKNNSEIFLTKVNGEIIGELTNEMGDYQCLVEQGCEDIIITASNLKKENFVSIGRIVALEADENGNPMLNSNDINLEIGDMFHDTEEDAFDIGAVYEEGESIGERIIERVALLGEGKYDYSYKVNEGTKVTKPTRSGYYWNPYHIGNKYTIAKLELDKTDRGLYINPAQIR